MVNLKIKVPKWVKDELGEKELIKNLALEALTKREYFRTKMLSFEEKYGLKFSQFEKKIKKKKKENFKEWDDLIIWEGYYESYREWEGKYKELLKCMKQ